MENAIAFARYQQGNFGWAVVVPGYNFTLANVDRPLDAAAAASLATKGVFAPLLLTDQAERLPRPLERYFLSVQPGYEEAPTRPCTTACGYSATTRRCRSSSRRRWTAPPSWCRCRRTRLNRLPST